MRNITIKTELFLNMALWLMSKCNVLPLTTDIIAIWRESFYFAALIRQGIFNERYFALSLIGCGCFVKSKYVVVKWFNGDFNLKKQGFYYRTL